MRHSRDGESSRRGIQAGGGAVFFISIEYVRGKLFEYWRSLLGTIDMSTAEAAEMVVGSNKQPLYWLAFPARHERALEFWEKIRHIEPNPQIRMF